MNVPESKSGIILRMPSLSVLDLDGKDADAILHNLTTNHVKSLESDGPGIETFITNVKGKCLGHVLAFRTQSGFRLIGAGASGERASQSEAIAEHADRYTIREDAVPSVKDDQLTAWLCVGVPASPPPAILSRQSIDIDSNPIETYVVPWVRGADGSYARLILVPADSSCSIEKILKTLEVAGAISSAADVQTIDDEEASAVFHSMRVTSGFPWYGIDINESHLPQEVGREPQTISFTKGCYLGQETVARLDALGQVQKMLVPWSIQIALTDNQPTPNVPSVDTKLPIDPQLLVDTKLYDGGEKPVGRLTSVAGFCQTLSTTPTVPNGTMTALGYARRSHFEPGATATAVIDEVEFIAKVIPSTQEGV